MIVFRYGSLMNDRWEERFGGTPLGKATLVGYRRSFNKQSTKNWGTPAHPAPILGLEPEPHAECIGAAFEFHDARREEVLAYLRKREGRGIRFEQLPVRLRDGKMALALTAVNDRRHPTYIGSVSLRARASMARDAAGVSGSCLDYVKQTRDVLRSMGVYDPAVEEFSNAIAAPRWTQLVSYLTSGSSHARHS